MANQTSKQLSSSRSSMIRSRQIEFEYPCPTIILACIAGFLGTCGHTLVCYLAPYIGMPKVNINGILGSPLFHNWIPPTFTESWLAGLALHFTLGAIAFPLAYVAVAYRVLPGSLMVKSMLWAMALWLVGQTVVMPLLGMGSFFAHLPEAMITYLLAHVAYGAIFGAYLSTHHE